MQRRTQGPVELSCIVLATGRVGTCRITKSLDGNALGLDDEALKAAFDKFAPERVVNLAAQAGVRYSLENPRAYIDSNIVGFLNILEACRHRGIEHLVYASSSSVYGANRKLPFSVEDSVDHPVSLYAATKKTNELMAHTYSHLFGLPTTGLRFFTVYGPWGRPDMALFKFTKGILEGTPIDIYNHGEMFRDFTFVTDLVRAIRLLIDTPPVRPDSADDIDDYDSLSPVAPYRVVNIGNSAKVRLLDFVEAVKTITMGAYMAVFGALGLTARVAPAAEDTAAAAPARQRARRGDQRPHRRIRGPRRSGPPAGGGMGAPHAGRPTAWRGGPPHPSSARDALRRHS